MNHFVRVYLPPLASVIRPVASDLDAYKIGYQERTVLADGAPHAVYYILMSVF
jgi:hypothetical protein